MGTINLLVPGLQVVSNGKADNQYPHPHIPGGGGGGLVTCIYINGHLKTGMLIMWRKSRFTILQL